MFHSMTMLKFLKKSGLDSPCRVQAFSPARGLALGLTLAVAVVFCAFPACAAAPAAGDPDGKPSSVPGYSMGDLTRLSMNITRTGLQVGMIQSIYRPRFLNVSDASLSMDDRDPVFIVKYPNGIVRIYPQRIAVWHEVINDVLPDIYTKTRQIEDAEKAGDTYSLSYSPLTGAVVGFRSMAGRFPSTFAATGDILNANSILYDHSTGSLWSQLLAVCLDGPLKGRRLERIPVLWATWGGARQVYPKAEVLSSATGMKRNYGQDPYGSYYTSGNYYDDTRVLHPVARFDNRLPPKKRILGLELDNKYGAVIKEDVARLGVMNSMLGLTPVVSVYDPVLQTVRVFDRRLEGENEPLSFVFFEGKYVDERTRSEWSPEGVGEYGRFRGKELKPVYAMDAMWFAWVAFHPDTEIFGLPESVAPMR